MSIIEDSLLGAYRYAWDAGGRVGSITAPNGVVSLTFYDPAGRKLGVLSTNASGQELSRSIWAPPLSGMQRQTRWFYERARGQYHDALAENPTEAELRKWELIHPRNQLITKTDLAKYEQTWSQLPHIVSSRSSTLVSALGCRR